MTRKALLLLLCMILSGLADAALFAEAEQIYPVSWDKVGGAGGYRVELQNGRGETLLSKTVGKDVLQYSFRLQPGNYRFRVTTLSVAMLDEGATQWYPVVVEVPTAPVIAQIKPRELPTNQDQVVSISGKHFSRQVKAQLIDPAGKKSPLQIRAVELTSIQVLVPALPLPGDYGILLINGETTLATVELKALKVAYPIPIFGKLRPSEIRLGLDDPSFSAAAERLSSTAKVVVSRSGGDSSPVADNYAIQAVIESGSIQVRLDPRTAPGDYDVYLINHVAEAPVLVGKLKILPAPAPAVVAPLPLAPATPPSIASPPADAPAVATAPTAGKSRERRFLTGLGWSFGLPLTEWAGIYSPTPKGVFLRLDYSLSPIVKPASGSAWNFAVGLDAHYFGLSKNADPELVPSSIASLSLAVDPSATLSLPGLSIRGRLGGGLVYSKLSLTSPVDGSSSFDSFDILAMGELGVDFPIVSRARLGLALTYERLFLTQGMDLLGVSTYATFDF